MWLSIYWICGIPVCSVGSWSRDIGSRHLRGHAQKSSTFRWVIYTRFRNMKFRCVCDFISIRLRVSVHATSRRDHIMCVCAGSLITVDRPLRVSQGHKSSLRDLSLHGDSFHITLHPVLV